MLDLETLPQRTFIFLWFVTFPPPWLRGVLSGKPSKT